MQQKILVVMFQDFSKSFGATRKYSEMIEYLSEHFDIALFCVKGNEGLPTKWQYSTRLVPPQKKDLNGNRIGYLIFEYMYFYACQIVTLFRILREHGDITCVHIRHDTYSWPSAVILFIFGKRMIADGKIYSTYAIQYDKRLEKLRHIMVPLERLILKLYWRFYVYSENYTEELLKFGLASEKLFFIPPSINIKRIPTFPINEQNMYNIGYFGELHDYSNVKLLLKAFEQVVSRWPKSRLYVIGDGECLDALKAMSSELGLNEQIVFTGRLSPMELFNYFNNFCVSVNPTILFAGAESTKRIESLASGKIVFEALPANVGSKIDNDGLIYFNGNDPLDLSEKICYLFSNPQIMHEYSLRSKKMAINYDISNYVRLVNLINEGADLDHRGY